MDYKRPPKLENESANPASNHLILPPHPSSKNGSKLNQDGLKRYPSKLTIDNESFYISPNRRKHRRLKTMFIIQFIMVLLIFVFVVAVTGGIVYIALQVNAIIIKADNAIHNNPVSNIMGKIKTTYNAIRRRPTPAPNY